jgi:hypothetical protein
VSNLLSFKEFCDHEKLGIYLDDLPLDLSMEDSYRLFKVLPMDMKCGIIEWGYADTCVRENIFEWVIQKIYGLRDCKHYYEDYNKNYANPAFAIITETQWKELEDGH